MIESIPLKWIEEIINKRLPIEGGSGLSKSDPLVLAGIHKGEVPGVEQMILELTLSNLGLLMTSFKQQLTVVEGRYIDEVCADFYARSGKFRNAEDPLKIYFDITLVM